MDKDLNRQARGGEPGHAPGEVPFGMGRAYAFAIFNGLSSQVVLGGPVILYVRQLGASATVLGIVAGMMPLLTMFQLPAAQYVGRTGYKRFMSNGWTTRLLFVFLLSLVPLSGGFLEPATRLSLVLALLFLFNLARGISSCAWLPWITGLVPSSLRGQYLTREQVCSNLAGAVSFGLAAMAVGRGEQEKRFSIVFLVSAVVGMISLRFLRKIPDVHPPPEEVHGKGPVPWLEISAYPPFRRLLWINLVWAFSYGGLLTFIADYLRGAAGFHDDRVLVAMVAFFVGGMASVWVADSRLDRLGSKPALVLTVLLCKVFCVMWLLQAGGLIRSGLGLASGLMFVLGLSNAVYLASTNRLAMLTVPKAGRSHFFALFSVVLNMMLGLAPVGWGLVLDVIGHRQGHWAGLDWNQYTVFFSLVTVSFGVVLGVVLRLREDRAARVDALLHELLVHDPKRAIGRLFTRG